ncbi:MAG TPA: type II toxin-antitoxin system Phd/YefM family antitoxin [Actinophytocola sp.]|uniref:type II toxin-antitoxin system Phd/YefM family antitoxin n=1 Tax=Actinophytocola sp. TaxID=1872138 RepID=UPI002DDCE995|nr:type II toxin-antitoxin system Phd/YefM family antitoxin [Actinophytocola sp.]HEV2784328.1 type II toxin-antitoxin system Phd/YefM family antitoxin [Actinophytocola sp.]
MPERPHWQVQEAKQRFSEVLRAVENEGPQTITRHGEEVAVVIDIDQYRRLTEGRRSFKEVLMGPPISDEIAEVLEEIESERKNDFPPLRDFEIELGLDRPVDEGSS